MLIRIQEMLSKGTRVPIHTTMNVDELLKNNKDVLKAGPLDIRLEASAEEKVVKVEGELAIDLELACSRCLEPTHEHVDIPFFERFQTLKAADGEEEDEDIIKVKEDKVDLTPYVEESLLLHVPFIPLCQENCQGLCPQCGTNLNEHQCGCAREGVDPRFAALKDLFKP
ncbi:YceD family protein [Paenibacillus abyssi]|uniref:Metal-binding protein n=1 Tax=Paenibacillus abyssi TaxID=1340531 RepID=A0A917D813_9BACL|nr:DUF177 domain-containing protein [Paenibacillus abyssi]GGG12698.1 hypothetical protein GCM10010916_32020 [Paenibacillus abyssi]